MIHEVSGQVKLALKPVKTNEKPIANRRGVSLPFSGKQIGAK
jgi:hypothetical protein